MPCLISIKFKDMYAFSNSEPKTINCIALHFFHSTLAQDQIFQSCNRYIDIHSIWFEAKKINTKLCTMVFIFSMSKQKLSKHSENVIPRTDWKIWTSKMKACYVWMIQFWRRWGAFKYYVITFLTFLGPPTSLMIYSQVPNKRVYSLNYLMLSS